MSRTGIAARLAAVAAGLLMVHAASPTGGYGAVAAVLALAAVLASVWIRRCATVAVLLVVAVVALGDTSPVAAAVSGLAAVIFLALCHSSASLGVVLTPASVVGALSFTAIAVAATVIPVSVPWGPLLAPVAALAVFVVATRALTGGQPPDAS